MPLLKGGDTDKGDELFTYSIRQYSNVISSYPAIDLESPTIFFFKFYVHTLQDIQSVFVYVNHVISLKKKRVSFPRRCIYLGVTHRDREKTDGENSQPILLPMESARAAPP